MIKLFEGIKSLNFDEEKFIHGMYSTEKEYVEYEPLIDTVKTRGYVDEWLI